MVKVGFAVRLVKVRFRIQVNLSKSADSSMNPHDM